jgi:hypothetical protein
MLVGSISELQHELTPEQRAFMAQLLTDNHAHADDVEIELIEREVTGVELILPPGCRTESEMLQNLERKLIWVPDDA